MDGVSVGVRVGGIAVAMAWLGGAVTVGIIAVGAALVFDGAGVGDGVAVAQAVLPIRIKVMIPSPMLFILFSRNLG